MHPFVSEDINEIIRCLVVIRAYDYSPERQSEPGIVGPVKDVAGNDEFLEKGSNYNFSL